jgi:hypothetical protein
MNVAGIAALGAVGVLAIVWRVAVAAQRRRSDATTRELGDAPLSRRLASRGRCERPGLDIGVRSFLSTVLVALFVFAYLGCFLMMLEDIGAHDRGEAMTHWRVWGPILVGSPLVLVLYLRAAGLTTRPIYTTAGVVGLIFLLMDAGGLTIRRFMLWPVWAPTLALVVVHQILTAPSRVHEDCQSGSRKPLFKTYKEKTSNR